MRHLARIYFPPISWVHPLLPFVGHAGSYVTISLQRSAGRPGKVPFSSSSSSSSSSVSHAAKYVGVYRRIIHGTWSPYPTTPCGIISTPPNKWYRARQMLLAEIHGARGYKLFFSRAKATCSAIRNEGRGKEIPFSIERYNFARFKSSCNNDRSAWFKSPRKWFHNLTQKWLIFC